jgi:hypothetical protein
MDWKTGSVKAASLIYGLFTLAVFVLLATLDGSIFRASSEKAKKELAAGTDLILST